MLKTIPLPNTLCLIQDQTTRNELAKDIIRAINAKHDLQNWLNDRYLILKEKPNTLINCTYVEFLTSIYQLWESLTCLNANLYLVSFVNNVITVKTMDVNNSLNYSSAIKVDTQLIKKTFDGLAMLVSNASYKFQYPIDQITTGTILNEMIRDYLETTAVSMRINEQYVGYSLINQFEQNLPAIKILVNDVEFMQRFTVLFTAIISYYQMAIQPALQDVLNHGNTVNRLMYQELDSNNVLWIIEGMWYAAADSQSYDY